MLTVSEAAALLRSFDNILILTHVRPDGDTVGCAAALCCLLYTSVTIAVGNTDMVFSKKDVALVRLRVEF